MTEHSQCGKYESFCTIFSELMDRDIQPSGLGNDNVGNTRVFIQCFPNLWTELYSRQDWAMAIRKIQEFLYNSFRTRGQSCTATKIRHWQCGKYESFYIIFFEFVDGAVQQLGLGSGIRKTQGPLYNIFRSYGQSYTATKTGQWQCGNYEGFYTIFSELTDRAIPPPRLGSGNGESFYTIFSELVDRAVQPPGLGIGNMENTRVSI